MSRFTLGMEGDGKYVQRKGHRYPPKLHIDGPNGERVRLTAEYNEATETTTYTMWKATPKGSGCTCREHQHHQSVKVHEFTVKDGA